MAFTVTGGKVVAIDVLADPERLQRLTPSVREVMCHSLGAVLV